MSKFLITYFSRTGTCKRISDKLSKELPECDIDIIKDDIDWSGAFGFVKGGFMAFFKRQVPIKYDKDPAKYDNVILLTPIWAKTYPPAVRSYLNKESANIKNLVLVTNCDKTVSANLTKNITVDGVQFKHTYFIVNTKNHETRMVDDIALELNK